MVNNFFKITVVYATPLKQYCLEVKVAEETSIKKAIENSGILAACPEISLNDCTVGVFSKFRSLTDKVQAGDRIEIYRPLLIDPKEARRQKAKKTNDRL